MPSRAIDAWQPVALEPACAELGVEVHAASLDVEPERLETLASFLTAEERQRAARFVVPVVRDRWIAGRGSLRLALGAWMRCDPVGIELILGPFGKPGLRPEIAREMRFNLSHSGSLALLARVSGREIGVDVERVRVVRHAEKIAERYFSEAERRELGAMPEEERALGFLRGWTRKEAFLKALGSGLARPLASFDVTLAHDDARVLRDGDRVLLPSTWVLSHLEPAVGFVGAVAITRI